MANFIFLGSKITVDGDCSHEIKLLASGRKVMTNLSSVQFSHSVVYDSLWPHESQHARPPCPSPTPGVYSNSCPSSWWCHPAISSSVVSFSSCPQSLPASGSFPMSQLFTWGGQSIGVSALASVLPSQHIKKQRHHFANKGPYSQSHGFFSSVYRYKTWDIRRPSTKILMLSNCGAGEDSWESLGQQGDQTSQL